MARQHDYRSDRNGDIRPFANSLSQNYPNPFNPRTTIRYSIKERGSVTLKVFNVAGQLVKTLVNAEMDPGAYSISWNGSSNEGDPVSSGVYFYKISAPGFTKTRQLVLVK